MCVKHVLLTKLERGSRELAGLTTSVTHLVGKMSMMIQQVGMLAG